MRICAILITCTCAAGPGLLSPVRSTCGLLLYLPPLPNHLPLTHFLPSNTAPPDFVADDDCAADKTHLSLPVKDLDKPIVTGKNIDAAGAGASSISPGWLTQLNLLWGGKGVSGGC